MENPGANIVYSIHGDTSNSSKDLSFMIMMISYVETENPWNKAVKVHTDHMNAIVGVASFN